MTIRLFILFLLCGFYAPLAAQNESYRIQASVKDASSGQPLPYVATLIQTPDSNYIDGTITNESGVFSLQLPAGVYTLSMNFIGYQKKDTLLRLYNHLDLKLLMNREAQTLNTIEVIEERTAVEQKIDRKVIHVGKDLQSSGGDALEVLNQLAEVQTNPDGGIELRGSGNVVILINGKPSPLAPQDLLQQIEAASIQQIELITAPSAKYQADGLSGMINIITQKNKKTGFHAALNTNVNSNPQYRSSLSFSHGSPHLNLSMQTAYANTRINSRIERDRTSETFEYQQKSSNHFDGTVKTIMGGLDWFLNQKNEFSISAHFTDNSHLITNTAQVTEDLSSYEFIARNQHAHLSAEYNMNYRRSFDRKGHYLEADFQLSDNQNDLGAEFERPDQLNQQFLDYHTQISRWALDYALPFSGNQSSLEAGLLYTFKSVNNQQFLELEKKERFEFEEKTLALYGLFKKNYKKLSLQLGLRVEDFSSQSTFQNRPKRLNQHFLNWFPSTHLTYKISEHLSTNFAYNRRTSRPGLWHVNPFANASDPFFNREGNTSLQPEFSHNIEWNTSIQQNSWSVSPSLFFREKTNLIIPVYQEEANGQVIQSFDNLGESRSYGTELALSFSPADFLKISFNGNYYWEKILSEENIELGSRLLTRHNFTLRNQIKANKQLSLDLSWFYRGKGIYRYSQLLASGKIDLAIRWKVLKGKGSLNARFTDLFNTFQSESFLFGQGFEERNFRKWPSRLAYLSFNIKFASSQNLKKRNRNNRRLDKSGALE